MPGHIQAERFPRERPPLTTAIEPLVNDPSRLIDEHTERSGVERHAIVADVSPYLGAENTPKSRQRVAAMHHLSPPRQLDEFGSQPGRVGLYLRDRMALTGATPVEGKAQKRKHRSATSLAATRPMKRHHPRLCLVQR